MDTPSLALTSPRAYATAILQAGSVAAQRALFERCPFEWRALVREYVKSAQAQQAKPKPAAPSPPAAHQPRHTSKKSKPEVGNAHIAQLRAAVGRAPHPPGSPHA